MDVAAHIPHYQAGGTLVPWTSLYVLWRSFCLVRVMPNQANLGRFGHAIGGHCLEREITLALEASRHGLGLLKACR